MKKPTLNPFHALMIAAAGLACLNSVTPTRSLAGSAAAQAAAEEEYDRLDGMGASGKKVHVIEWEGNLEIHVYPGGSLKGLALKLDKRNKDKPVMVIGYRFDSDPQKQLIRRAILGIDMHEGFKVYRDPSSGSEYDKIVISNNGLSGDMVAFKLDAELKQLYPDGHPALAQGPDGGKDGYKPRRPASTSGSTQSGDSASTSAPVDEAGTIKPFNF